MEAVLLARKKSAPEALTKALVSGFRARLTGRFIKSEVFCIMKNLFEQ